MPGASSTSRPSGKRLRARLALSTFGAWWRWQREKPMGPRRHRRWNRLPTWLRKLGGSVAAGVLLGVAGFLWWWWRQPPLARVDMTDRRPLVIIDAGHGGVDGGTQGFGVLEKEVALATALRTSRELRKRGVRTVLSREGDVSLSLEERIQFANAQEPAALVSVHFNFSENAPAVRGVEAYFSDPKDLSAQSAVAASLGVTVDDAGVAAASRSLADALRTGVSARAGTPDRGTHNRPDLAVTRRSRCPAALVECAYLSNRSDAARAATPEWQTRLAEGLADGVLAWLEKRGR